MLRYLWRWVKNKKGLYDVTIDIKEDKDSDCVYANYVPVIEKEEEHE